ncbi:MAG: molybdopterin-dependent oxidoreductase [Streptosporangiales bacterium]|nr:molybdopterin-dependent oxidoreductase [Streptosporangiales bacterium]
MSTFSPTSSHWGAFLVRDGANGIEVRPHPDDPAPSPLIGNVPGAARHATRVRRPAIRRGWLEDGPGPSAARGRDSFVEVSWDEAIALAATELDRVRSRHGNQAIFGGSYGWSSAGRFHHAQSQVHRFLNAIGGYTSSRNNYSQAASLVLLPHVVGDANAVIRRGSTWPSVIENTELLVAFGGVPGKNVMVTPGGVTRHHTPGHLAALGAAGVEVALVSPLREDMPETVPARWYPVVPATDTALMLGLAHTLLAEGLHDTAFLHRYCAGFDTFRDHLLGRPDGVVKDAAWAAAICGLDAADIVELARKMARSRTFVTVTWSLQRAEHGEQPVWAGIALAAMLGQIGLPGGGFGHGYGSMADVGDTGLDLPLPTLPQGHNAVRAFIPVARIADLLLHPGDEYDYDGERLAYPDIRLVYWAGGNPFHHHQDLNRLREAFTRPDTVIVNEPHWTATARHADIVLPATIPLEREDLGAGRRDSSLIAMHRAMDPVGEARDDYWIFSRLAERLGADKTFTEGRDTRQWLEHLYGRWREGMDRRGHDTPSFAEFWAAGEVRLPPGEPQRTLFADFRADPEAHPLRTPSGRIEITSAAVAGFGYPDCPGHPVWLPPEDWPGAEKAARFPLLLIANQPATRLHSQLDVGGFSQAGKVAGREPVRIHPDDAKARGIVGGDVVRVFNDRGACLAGALITDQVRPGVLRLPTGAWFDPVDDGDGPLCAHGNPNVLTSDRPTSRLTQGCRGQHALVEVERLTEEPPPVNMLAPPAGIPSPD